MVRRRRGTAQAGRVLDSWVRTLFAPFLNLELTFPLSRSFIDTHTHVRPRFTPSCTSRPSPSSLNCLACPHRSRSLLRLLNTSTSRTASSSSSSTGSATSPSLPRPNSPTLSSLGKRTKESSSGSLTAERVRYFLFRFEMLSKTDVCPHSYLLLVRNAAPDNEDPGGGLPPSRSASVRREMQHGSQLGALLPGGIGTSVLSSSHKETSDRVDFDRPPKVSPRLRNTSPSSALAAFLPSPPPHLCLPSSARQHPRSFSRFSPPASRSPAPTRFLRDWAR